MKTSSEWMESILVSNQQNPFPPWVINGVLQGSSNLRVCGWNAAGSPLKWNLFASTFLCCYSWLPITQTIANSNLTLTRTKVDFPNTLNVILPSVTRNPDNLYLPLIRSIFFSSDHFYITWPSITQVTF